MVCLRERVEQVTVMEMIVGSAGESDSIFPLLFAQRGITIIREYPL